MGSMMHIVVMPGDGIGVEVMGAACAVLEAAAARFDLRLSQDKVEGGALHYRETGTALSEAGFDKADAADAVLFGAMGLPDVRYSDGTEIAPHLDMRVRMGLYAGVRPIRAIPGVPLALGSDRAREIDFVVLRESTEGAFASRWRGEVENDATAREQTVITRTGTERLSRFAFRLAAKRVARRGRAPEVRLIDKSNVFRAFAFMRKVFLEVASEFPDIPNACHYIDALALDLVRRPWDFDVLPMENLFGDIISDLGAGLVGGMGFAPAAEIGDEHALFQPSHGSAPDIAGRGIANPTAMILSMAMMLDWLGERHGQPAFIEAARAVENAVDRAFGEGHVRTYDIGGRHGTAEVARVVIEGLAAPVHH